MVFLLIILRESSREFVGKRGRKTLVFISSSSEEGNGAPTSGSAIGGVPTQSQGSPNRARECNHAPSEVGE
ncbi:hypothetical protein BRADI_5g12165v3 [Brachypodium distachyon]|uniref:Uncharacterized protein n=1 Tax=Brachypodium distachyon TaxID=15368 RepID=A0A2K2CGQ0_BRADI|nr:hypothetical protein BRADI_5g12165v3 [Brachypodium distachyon]